ncbi:MAG: TonB-dependent receptor plug domain-containing protein, partial [Achromobacter spanius]
MFHRPPLRPLAAALFIALSLPSAFAQTTPAAVSAGAVQHFDLPAATLGDTLTRIARQTGRAVSVDPALVAGRNAPAIVGDYTAEDAVRRALAGSGLELAVTANGTLSARRVVEGTTVLEPVRVTGSLESPTAHVDGYVAQHALSGTKTDTALIETPQSVSVVTSDQIRIIKAGSVADALGYTPGVSAQSPAFSRMVDDLMLRGFNVAAGNSGQLRDGLKLQSSVYDGGQEPYGLERVEVLRGASSVLYGQLSPGGVV